MAGNIIVCPNCNERIENPLIIKKEKFLIVEGRDDEEFFGTYLEKLKIIDVQVAGIGGKTRIRAILKALRTDPLFNRVTSLGIIRDADDNYDAAFQSIQNGLKDAGLPIPRNALIQTKTSPKVTVMILPSKGLSGALEDICLESVKDNPAMLCVDDYFKCLEAKGVYKSKEHLAKAKVRVFLSSCKDPTLSLGIAAKKGVWPLDSVLFKGIKEFLQSL